jgi:phospholipid N-methyltransferase
MTYSATYSPEDNKLRLSASSRLDAETYARVRGAGFIWAPKQGIFVAPMWTPEREDLAIELAGEIDDEDTSLVDRAEQRAERFEQYSESRADDAESARAGVARIADGIPMGQPILIGHHSEKHARRDAEKIENGMRRAVKMWETSQYWQQRAAGAIRHAKYKELPAVRARRIKGLEADLRKQERYIADAENALRAWEKIALIEDVELQEKAAIHLAGNSGCGRLTLRRKEGDRPDWDQRCDAYSGLSNHYPSLYAKRTVAEVLEAAREAYPRSIAHHGRWALHYSNRLTYERAMLAESGGTVADQNAPQKGGGCRCWASPNGGWSYIQKVNKVSVTVLDNWNNGGNNFTRVIPFDKLKGVMSVAAVAEARADGRLLESADKTGFFLKAAPTPERDACADPEPPKVPAPNADFEAMRESLKAGVQVVSAPQLFPTPAALAARMVALADVQSGETVLEPSAGTGAIVRAVIDAVDTEIVGYEINRSLVSGLTRTFPSWKLCARCEDFLTVTEGQGQFPVVLMNPPFVNAQDIAHIEHAVTFLKPGGRLVAICANGPRQQARLKPLVERYGGTWEDLPADTFKESGTGVNTALIVLTV